jgi:hypothetical protein
MCKHYKCCRKEHCEDTCSDTHLCFCGGNMVRPLLTSDQQEDLIRCIPTAGDEVELCIAIKKLCWMNISTYMLSACDNAIHSEGFPYSEHMINLFANWAEFEQAAQYDVSMEEITFLTNALITAEHCTDFMQKSIIFGTICMYLMEYPSILHRSKRCRDIVLDKVCDVHVFAGKQKTAILAAAAEEGGVMDQNQYVTMSWIQDTIMKLLELPVYA